MRIPDVYDMWERENYIEEMELKKRQPCAYCDEPIQADSCYYINGDYICEDCMKDNFQVETPVDGD